MPLFTFLLLIVFSMSDASISSYSSKSYKRHYSKNFLDPGMCLQDATCEPISNSTCFGTVLPYSFTSIALAEDSTSQFDVQDNLALWQGLRTVPRCWAVVQPLLCAVYMPKCENGSLFLPSQEMCRITREPCKSVEVMDSWPAFLRCENKKLFPPQCRNPLQEVKFNTSYKCISPLVETDDEDNWFHEVEGCGVQCQDPFYTEEEHDTVHRAICVLAVISFLFLLFSVITIRISWTENNHFPAVIIFYINMCLAIASIGWLIQFISREETVCNPDGSIRTKQLRSRTNLCNTTFVLIYPCSLAAVIWFAILAYSWHVYFQDPGLYKDRVKKKVAIFHIGAWSIPVILSTAVMSTHEIDGNSMSGICFVGNSNQSARLGYLLFPVGLSSVIGGFFLLCGLHTLIKVKQKIKNDYEKKIIKSILWRIGVFSAVTLIFIIFTFVCHAYDFMHRKEWENSLREYILCKATNSASLYSHLAQHASGKCVLKNKPSIWLIFLPICSFFGFGILMSSWVWARSTIDSWKRCFSKKEKTTATKSHEAIAKAFPRRHELNQSHVSFSVNSTHEDPLGMNIGVNSVAPREIPLLWAAALPQFLMKRNVFPAAAGILPRHYSSVSDVSRHISLDSFNQQNLDSLSMQISEQEYAHALRHQRRKTRKERERFLKANRIAPWFPGSRRSSDTSLQSSMAASIAAAAAAKRAGIASAQVTKSTSTGDLGTDAIVIRQPSVVPLNRALIQRQAMPNPPFTHGMTDNSHRLNGRASTLASSNASQSFTPIPMQVNSLGMVPPVYGTGYGLGYLGGMIYPGPNNGIFPGYVQQNDLNCSLYNSMAYMPYGSFQSPESLLCQYQPNLLPLHPRADSASETEYLPIIMSDSEFTDAGHRSYDETQQVYNTQRLLQERVAQQIANAAEVSQPKPVLQPQACAKSQLLERMGSFDTKASTSAAQPVRPSSGRKSPHSEAPPPSPAESIKSFGDLDDVFLKEPLNMSRQSSMISSREKVNHSCTSLQKPESDSFMQRFKSRLKRATSFSQNDTGFEAIELTPKQCHSSLGQLSLPKSKNRASNQNIDNKEPLKCSEGASLLPRGEISENVSR